MKTITDILKYTALIVLGIGLLASCKKDKTDKDEINTVTDVDGNKYKTVKIGEKVWMAENLRTSKYNDGAPIQYVTEKDVWLALFSGAWCYYNNEAGYNNTYRKLYNWYAASTGKLCPTGWHIPTTAEWVQLMEVLGGEAAAGGKMKATDHWTEPNTEATNESGFTGLPGGWRLGNGTFDGKGTFGEWWSPIVYSGYRFCYGLTHDDGKVRTNYWGELIAGRSWRCVKD